MTLLDPSGHNPSADVVVTCDPGTRLAAVREQLAATVGAARGSAVFADGEPLEGTAVLGLPPLLDGAVLTVGRAGGPGGRRAGTTGGLLELHVVSGPDAGSVLHLAPGRHRLGRAGPGVVRIEDPDVSRLHAELAVTAAGVSVRDLGSTNGTSVDAGPVGPEPVEVTLQSRIVLGSSTLRLRLPAAATAATRVVDGQLEVNRVPRLVAPTPGVRLRLPPRPPPRTSPRVPVVALVLPVVVAVPLALLLGSPYFLAIAFVSPLLLLGTVVSDRVTGRRDHAALVARHADAEREVRAQVAAAVTAEEHRRRRSHPDAAEVGRTAAQVLERLWERSPADGDWLDVRLGTARLPSAVSVEDPGAPPGPPAPPPEATGVPVVVPLARAGVLGVAGDRRRGLGLLRSLVGQVAVLHPPQDARVVVLTADPAAAADWAWAARLPHARPCGELPADAEALVGWGADQAGRRVGELCALLDRRAAGGPGRAGPTGSRRPGGGCDVVVVLDGAQALRAVAGVARLLREGPALGVLVVCLDRERARLPVECAATAVLSGEVATRLQVRVAPHSTSDGCGGSDAAVDDATADLVAPAWADRLGHALAPLRDAAAGEPGGVPASVRLVDLLPVDATSAQEVVRLWSHRPSTTATPLGTAAAGPVAVDLARDGPHVLVAGTTGAGKSELLRCLVTGLAVGNRPDELCFVLVDYKGGSAFAGCARLPHVVGLVTDLDGALTGRALESLGAEVRRRERLLAGTGSATLAEHREQVRRTGAAVEVPARLVLVVDEFRALAEELPDFLAGVVRLAAVGRSLGVHLVLATQRPAGVVSADVRANVNLRVALRVQDVADSVDVVDAPDAARIPAGSPGRAVVRVGSGPLAAVQVAQVSGAAAAASPSAPRVRRLDPDRLGDPPPRPAAAATAPGPDDLSSIVEAVAAAAVAVGARPAPSPWLPPLPDVVTLTGLRAAAAAEPDAARAGPGALRLAYGLLDDPAGQARREATWDLAADGPLVVAGTARSGRSSTLRALLASLAAQAGPGDAWAYVVDGGGSLTDARALPHVGAVVDPADTERSARLLQRVAAEVESRRGALDRAGAGDLGEHRRAATAAGRPALPWVVLAVDGWEAVEQAWGDPDAAGCLDLLHDVVREGPRAGVLVVVAGGRSVLGGRLAAAVGHRLVLRLADPADVVLAGVAAREAPTPWRPGRGLLVGGRAGGPARQVQVALLTPDPAGSVQREALRAAAAGATARAPQPSGSGPPAVPAMPGTVGLDAVRAAPGWPLGVGGAQVAPVGLDPELDGPVLLVAGHPGSGRSTTLLTLADGALNDPATSVVVVAPPASPLRRLRGRPGVRAVLGSEDAAALRERLAAADRGPGRTVVLVDDLETLEGRPAEPVVQEVVAAATGAPAGSLVVVAAGSTPELLTRYSGLGAQLRRPGVGVLLGPGGPGDGDVLSVRLPRRTQRRPGRGVVVRRGRATPVQVALPDGPPARVGGDDDPAARPPVPAEAPPRTRGDHDDERPHLARTPRRTA